MVYKFPPQCHVALSQADGPPITVLHQPVPFKLMIVNITALLLAVSTVAGYALDGSKRHPRLQSKYDVIYDVCPGSIVDSGDWGAFSWYLYYSPANGGTNCAVVRNRSGRSQHMFVGLVREMVDIEFTPPHTDEGDFKYWAGGKKVTNTNGRCIEMRVIINRKASDSLNYLHLACG